jgi:catechol 2,3-dioxygenase-like lactoylglutathione lyase family enzyme
VWERDVHHVKLPVRDVERSRDWYCRVLRLVPDIDFVEEGQLMGVALRAPGSDPEIALRREPERAAALAGFNPVALADRSRAELEEQQFDHGPITNGHLGWVPGFHDPDGIEIRPYTLEPPHQP